MTTREFYLTIASTEDLSAELRDKAVELVASMDSKQNSARKRNSAKRAEENAPLVKSITELLGMQTAPMLTSEIAAACGISTSKASALLRKMTDDGVLVATDVKVPKAGTRKAYKLAVDDAVQMTDYERNTMN